MSYLRECPFCGNPEVGKIHPTHTFFHMTIYECGQCGAVIHFEDPSAAEGFDPDARFNRRAGNKEIKTRCHNCFYARTPSKPDCKYLCCDKWIERVDPDGFCYEGKPII